jgi:type IV pilus assembly protein PilA
MRRTIAMLEQIRTASRRDHDGGFTLMEILVVVIVIGVLAAIAIPLYLSQRQKGYDASVKSDLRVYSRELETYSTDHEGAYPAVTEFGQAAGGVVTVATGITVRASNGNTFGYFLNTAKTAFCVVSVNAKGTRPWEFISSKGGLQPAGTFAGSTTLPTACTTSSY